MPCRELPQNQLATEVFGSFFCKFISEFLIRFRRSTNGPKRAFLPMHSSNNSQFYESRANHYVTFDNLYGAYKKNQKEKRERRVHMFVEFTAHISHSRRYFPTCKKLLVVSAGSLLCTRQPGLASNCWKATVVLLLAPLPWFCVLVLTLRTDHVSFLSYIVRIEIYV